MKAVGALRPTGLGRRDDLGRRGLVGCTGPHQRGRGVFSTCRLIALRKSREECYVLHRKKLENGRGEEAHLQYLRYNPVEDKNPPEIGNS